jgi:hypothetical protein
VLGVSLSLSGVERALFVVPSALVRAVMQLKSQSSTSGMQTV